MQNTDFNVCEFGTTGDGKNKDTGAIQEAIDTCAANGGGTVYLPAGCYLCGTLYLKDNIEINLSPGAVIKGSPDPEDYNPDDYFSQNRASKMEKCSGGHLILAVEVKNVSITGKGTIDGNSPVFLKPHPKNKTSFVPKGDYRPGQMVYFCECENVKVNDVRLVNSPYWTLFIHGCDKVFINGLYVESFRCGCNGDGIDIDSSQNVTVSNCIIRSEDDSITLRGNNKPLKKQSKICQNICISNCIISSAHACGIRCGVGDGHVRNCSFSNIVINESNCGIMFCGRYCDGHDGVLIEELSFSDFRINAKSPFFLSCGYLSKSPVRKIQFSNIEAQGCYCSYIGGLNDNISSEIEFNNVKIRLKGGEDNSLSTPEVIETWKKYGKVYSSGSNKLPYGLLIENTEKIRLNDFCLQLDDQKGLWQNAIKTRNSGEINFGRVRIEGFENVKESIKTES